MSTLKNFKLTSLLLLLTLVVSIQPALSQSVSNCLFSAAPTSSGVIDSQNGWLLPTNGTLRVLFIYVEIDYDQIPSLDPMPNGATNWQKNQLPTWKNDFVDASVSNPQGYLTKYFLESSFGSFSVIGDYLVDPSNPSKPVIVKQSVGTSPSAVLNVINSYSSLQTSNGLTFSDFDKWTMNGAGEAKTLSANGNYDHVFFIYRNALNPFSGAGYTSSGSFGSLFGHQSDTYGVVTSYGDFPSRIVLHEFSHLLYGGNNFHVGGGQHPSGGANYVIPTQGGWSNMGSWNSSFLTCNAWDRDRLNWKGPGKTMNISCRNTANTSEVNTDLDASIPSQAGIFLVRDFMTTGDAIRIKLPYLVNGEYQQWIWFENHKTQSSNNSSFDKFQYQDETCVADAIGGLYGYIQIDKNIKSGSNTYSGYGDYLVPVPADGRYDLIIDAQTQQGNCVFSGSVRPFKKDALNENPFTGNHDQEEIPFDLDGGGFIHSTDAIKPYVENINNTNTTNLAFLGLPRHAFTLNGKKKIGIGSNPPLTPLMTLVSDAEFTGGIHGSNGEGLPNNRAIFLNGISVEILSQTSSGDLVVQVKFDDVDINEDRRWCAENIVLNPISSPSGLSCNLKSGKTLTIDRGITPTRIINPVVFNNKQLFTSPTNFTIQPNAKFNLESGSTLNITNGSTLYIKSGGKLVVNDATVHVNWGSKIVIESGGILEVNGSGSVIIEEESSLDYQANASIKLTDSGSRLEIWSGLNLGANAMFTFTGNGYLFINGNVTPTIGSGASIKLIGTGTSDLILKKNGIFTVNCNLTLQTGQVLVIDNEKLICNNSQLTLTTVKFITSVFGSGTYVHGNGLTRLVLNGCEFDCSYNNYRKALVVENSSASVFTINTSVFKNALIGVEYTNCLAPRFSSCTFTDCLTGIKLQDCGTTNILGTSISSQLLGTGIYANNVPRVYITSSSNISNNNIGIDATSTGIFLRGTSKVSYNQSYGIKILGYRDDVNQTYTSLLTIGDVGCGWVTNNYETAIKAENTLFAIDAFTHAQNGSGTITPNHFENNSGVIIDFCYGGSGSILVGPISARKNIWDVVNGASVAPSSSKFVGRTGQVCSYTLSNYIDYSYESSCYSDNSCISCGTSGGGLRIAGNIEGKRLSDCGSLFESAYAIDSIYYNAYTTFVQTDSLVDGFGVLSSISLNDSTYGWFDENGGTVSGKCLDFIRISSFLNPQGNQKKTKITSLSESSIIQNDQLNETGEIRIYPNPASSKVNVNYNEDVFMEIYSSGGSKVYSNKVGSNGEVNLDLPNGLFLINIKSLTGKPLLKEKLIIAR